jgi:glycosyltransferase involved in cell wall biosynthesis
MNDQFAHGLWAGSEAWSVSEALGESHASDMAMLAAADIFDAPWYLATYGDVAASGVDPATHFIARGWQEGRQPNFYFHTPWYLNSNPDVARAGINPVLHYIAAGEAEGRAPAEYFDLEWYAGRHAGEAEGLLLAHFLARKCTGQVAPLPEFDPAFYLSRYPDVAAAGVDPFQHYLLYGFKEGRDPSIAFDTRHYLHRYLDGRTDENPLLHYRRWRHALRLHTHPQPHETDPFEEARRFARPGPEFETFEPLPGGAVRQAKLLAFYLPQFHPIPENDTWWGTGFTEWTAIGRGMPRFPGHYQPRLPRDLGHYRLGDTPEGRATMRRQAEMARDAGLGGFIHYFYWFNRRRLLEAPTEAMLADRTIDFPFCLMWANENWTRRWDGSENEVLIAQDYDRADDGALVDCLARHFRDPRYIRLDGRPLLMVYRAADIPDTAATVARWRAIFLSRHRERPILVMAQAFDTIDPRGFGFDGAVEFPPHKLARGLPRRNGEIALFDSRLTANIHDYDDVVHASRTEPPPPFPLIRTAVPSWDNDARRQGAGLVLHGATPAKYQAWLEALVAHAAASPFMGAPIVCINAWNEWAEGAYLEPDMHYGGAWLNATARAVTRGGAGPTAKLLLVGHDAFPAGAQMLLLHLLRRLRRGHGVEAEYLLLGDGALAPDYAAEAPGMVVPDAAVSRVEALVAGWAARGFAAAIVNSAAAAWVAPRLRAAGFDVTLLVHELPGIMAEKQLVPGARAGAAAAARVIFPSPFVRDRFAATVGDMPADARILPQGTYRAAPFSPAARTRLRRRLRLSAATRLLVGAGYADLRKGFDLFLQARRAARRLGLDAVFCWLGELDPAITAYLGPEIAAAQAEGGLLLPGRQPDIAAWLSAADAFLLTSREDPYPSVVLEALAAGLPVLAFAAGGGIPDLLAATGTGTSVAMGDVEAMLHALPPRRTPAVRARRGIQAQQAGDFAAYAATLLRTALPALRAISVAVPNYNYARYLERRLSSIFAQTCPVEEVLLIDDASTDDSLEVARRVAADWRRDLALHPAACNSGSVFRQWRRAAELARGEFLWIAEADDEADPALLATLAEALAAQPGAVMALCDSRAIDAEGVQLWPDHHQYCIEAGAAALTRDGLFPARDFAARFLAERNLILNVSAVLWRREALLAALTRCASELETFRIAGDWRLYVELLADCDGSVAYIARPLNAHRRHAQSVTTGTAAAAHLEEIARMYRVIRERLAPDAGMRRRQASWLRAVAQRLGVETTKAG